MRLVFIIFLVPLLVEASFIRNFLDNLNGILGYKRPIKSIFENIQSKFMNGGGNAVEQYEDAYGDNAVPEEDHSKEQSHSHFSYDLNHGPETWAKDFPACAGKSQSPINIDSSSLIPATLPPLVHSNLWSTPDTLVLENNGHTLEFSGVWPEGKYPSVTGGPLKNKYIFKQGHIHWGLTDNEGSEHTVNGKAKTMELHVVHYNSKYGTYENATQNHDGLAVLAYFFDIGCAENPMLEKYITCIREVAGNSNKDCKVEPMPINILDLDIGDTPYITYKGSLTTPPCLEIVTWIVSTRPLQISSEQMNLLRTAVTNTEGEHTHNYRPVQKLNGRKVEIVGKL